MSTATTTRATQHGDPVASHSMGPDDGRTSRPRAAHGGTPSVTETAYLRAGVGALLREARTAADLSAAALARGAGADERTVRRLEHGERRPRRSLLADLARVIVRARTPLRTSVDPAEVDVLTDALADAAGHCLVPDTEYSRRRRRRARTRAVRAHWRLMRRASEASWGHFGAWMHWAESVGTAPITDTRVRVLLDQADDLEHFELYAVRRAWHIADRWPRPPMRWPLCWTDPGNRAPVPRWPAPIRPPHLLPSTDPRRTR